MVQVKTLDCAACGAPLDVSPGQSLVECSYCGRELSIERDRTQTDKTASLGVTDDLLRGYDGKDTGTGARHGVTAMQGRDWQCFERGVWPVGARASSTFGGSWHTDKAHGGPRVYPRYGDIPGAWAPRRRTSHTEWLEVFYPADAGEVQAIRVFETCAAGSTFALTVRDHDGAERLVWKRRPEKPRSEAQVLEVPLAPPQKVAAVRAYVTNDHATWTQLDTIGLVSVEPVPAHLRREPPRTPAAQPRSAATPIVVAVLLLGLVGAVAFFMLLPRSQQATPSSAQEAEPGTPTTILSESRMAEQVATRGQLLRGRTIWAKSGLRASSEYQPSDWSRHQLVGPPDVFPEHGDKPKAWASKEPDAGTEWVIVGFGAGVDALGVLVVETFNPGALVRVDDVSFPDAPVVLWRGTTEPRSGRSRVLSLTLGSPRRIRRLRLVLDTRRVAGWNEIDAVGLTPAQ